MKAPIGLALLCLGLCGFQHSIADQVLSTHVYKKHAEELEVVAYGPPFRTYELLVSRDLADWYPHRRINPNASNRTQEDNGQVSISTIVSLQEFKPYVDVPMCTLCEMRDMRNSIPEDPESRSPYEDHPPHEMEIPQAPPMEPVYFRYVGYNPTNWITVSTTTDVTGEYQIRLTLHDVTDLGGVTVDLEFDTNILSYTKGHISPFLTENGKVEMIFLERDERIMGEGKASVTVARRGPIRGVSGSDEILLLRFRVKDPSQTPLVKFKNITLSTMTGNIAVDPIFRGVHEWQGVLATEAP